MAYAFRLAAGRTPDARELGALRKSLEEMRTAYKGNEAGAKALLAIGASPSDPAIPVIELAAFTAVVNVILNMTK